MIRDFSEEDLEIIRQYLDENLSVRELVKMHKDYGRTRIANILDAYASLSEENATKIKLKRLGHKQHKEFEKIEEINQEELTYEQIENAYQSIMQKKETLTSISKKLNKNRDTVKKNIIDYLKDTSVIIEFKQVLKDNQNKAVVYDEFESLNPKEQKVVIFNKLNYRRKKRGRNEYSLKMLERKYERLYLYFQKRNSKIDKQEDIISEEDLLKMLYDYPTLLSMSLSNKIKPIVKQLDYKHLDFSRTSKILKENPAILGTSLERTNVQIRILKDTDTLDYAIERPRIFRTSPRLMYSLIKLWNDKKATTTPFITNKKLYEIYSKTPHDLEKIYDVKKNYGEEEYFDRR